MGLPSDSRNTDTGSSSKVARNGTSQSLSSSGLTQQEFNDSARQRSGDTASSMAFQIATLSLGARVMRAGRHCDNCETSESRGCLATSADICALKAAASPEQKP